MTSSPGRGDDSGCGGGLKGRRQAGWVACKSTGTVAGRALHPGALALAGIARDAARAPPRSQPRCVHVRRHGTEKTKHARSNQPLPLQPPGLPRLSMRQPLAPGGHGTRSHFSPPLSPRQVATPCTPWLRGPYQTPPQADHHTRAMGTFLTPFDPVNHNRCTLSLSNHILLLERPRVYRALQLGLIVDAVVRH